MFGYFWTHYLYEPLLNVLIYIYGNWAFENLGVAIIFLTVLLRLALLPFTVISHQSKRLYQKLDKKIATIKKDFKDDSVMQKEQIRELLRSRRVNPWAKSVTLGIQALVLVLLYQVFIGGINKTFVNLYRWVYHPDYINTQFLGFDLGSRSIFWALLVALILYFEIAWEQKKRKNFLLESEVVYRYFFPALSFLALYLLPMAKSLFILTSLIFSFMVGGALAVMDIYRKPEIEDDED